MTRLIMSLGKFLLGGVSIIEVNSWSGCAIVFGVIETLSAYRTSVTGTDLEDKNFISEVD